RSLPRFMGLFMVSHPQRNSGRHDMPRGGDSGSTAAANRRLFERHPVDFRARVTELDQFGNPGMSWECRLVDVSRGGIGLRSRRMSYQGRHMLVEVERARGQVKLLFGVVRQSRYSEGEGYA